ncbi:hypothetical protein KC963_03605 [Candidatus Saccharibacteria bacterium]|nr:hypothetical protein [Candidatus Saccharibacteria bacterium]
MSLAREEFAQMEAALMVSGDMFTDQFDRYRSILDVSVPVLGQFSIESTPPGFPPEEVRQDWVGLSLPVRFTVDIEQLPEVPIVAAEALHVLEGAGKGIARDWWRQYYAQEAKKRMPNVDDEGYPDLLANVSLLVFDPSCGTLQEDPQALRNEFLAALANPYYWFSPPKPRSGTK